MTVTNKQISRFNVFLLIVIFFISDDTITFGTTEHTIFIIAKYVIYVALIVTIPFSIKFSIFKAIISRYLNILILSILLTLIVNDDITGGYIYQIWILTLSYLIVSKIELPYFAILFNRVLYILCLISLFVFIITIYFSSLLTYFPVHENISGTQLTNLYLVAVYNKSNDIRNTGIFREPGVYMIYILFGLILELYYFTTANIKRVFVYLITLFTTVSTAAFIVLILVISGYYFNKSELKKRTSIMLAIFMLCIPLVTYYNPELYERVFSKLDVDSASYASALAREASVIINYRIFTENIFFGAGLNPYVDLFEYYSGEHYGVTLKANAESTNTYMSIFATYGITYGLIVLFAVYKLVKKLTLPAMPQMLLLVSLILMFSNEDMRYSLFFNILLFYGLKNISVSSQSCAATA